MLRILGLQAHTVWQQEAALQVVRAASSSHRGHCGWRWQNPGRGWACEHGLLREEAQTQLSTADLLETAGGIAATGGTRSPQRYSLSLLSVSAIRAIRTVRAASDLSARHDASGSNSTPSSTLLQVSTGRTPYLGGDLTY